MTVHAPRLAFAGLGFAPVRAIPRHAHATPIVICYTRGRGEVILDGSRLPFARGTVVCVPAGIPYAERSLTGFISLYLAIDGLRLDGVLRFDPGDDPRFMLAARLLLEESRRSGAESGGVGWSAAVSESLTLLIRSLRRHMAPPRSDPLVAAALELVDMHAADPLFTMAAAAARLRTTPRRLRAAFKADLGVTPLEHLTLRRIDDAKRLLASGGFAISDVAARVGFADSYYFSRVFRRATGSSPLAYRLRGAPR